MTITTMSGREFNHDASRAKRAANAGPVFITDRGRPAHVLLSFDDYQKLLGRRTKIADLLAMPDVGEIELDLPRARELPRAADLS